MYINWKRNTQREQNSRSLFSYEYLKKTVFGLYKSIYRHETETAPYHQPYATKSGKQNVYVTLSIVATPTLQTKNNNIT